MSDIEKDARALQRAPGWSEWKLLAEWPWCKDCGMWAPPHAHEHIKDERAWFDGVFGEGGTFSAWSATPERAPFDVLGVKPDATVAELKAAYRRRLMETHPDKGGDPAECRRVIAAWDALKHVGRVGV